MELVVADGLGAERRAGFSIVDLGRVGPSKPRRAYQGFLRAVRYLVSARPSIVHFHDPELIPVGLVAKALGSQVIYDVHEDVPRQILGRETMSKALRRFLALGASVAEWIGARVFNAIVCATPKIAERFPGGKTVLVQNFPILAELESAAPLPYAERQPWFIYMGVIAEMRGAREMAQAIESLKPQRDAKLYVAGTFRSPSLEAELTSSDKYSATVFLGWADRKQVARLLSNVRAGLVLFHEAPNHVDAQPNKLFEYMSVGLPVIASDFPLWRAVIDGAGCGLLVDPMDTTAIATAMDWILDNPAEAEAMGRRGQMAVESRYNWKSEGEKLLELYQEILGASSVK